jgi:hypothetical protein
VTNVATEHLKSFTRVAARAAVWASGQADWSESISRAPLSAGPAAAAAGTSGSANWGEYHLRLERVAAERCLTTRPTGSGSQASLMRLQSCPGSWLWPSCEPRSISNIPAMQLRSSSIAGPVHGRLAGSYACPPPRPSVPLVKIPAPHSVGVSHCIRVRNQPHAIRSPPRPIFSVCPHHSAEPLNIASAARSSDYEPLAFPSHTHRPSRVSSLHRQHPKRTGRNAHRDVRCGQYPGRTGRPNECLRHFASGSRAVSCLSHRKARRPFVSQTRTPESFPCRPLVG